MFKTVDFTCLNAIRYKRLPNTNDSGNENEYMKELILKQCHDHL
jgi:hypothetical protein